MQTHFMTEQTLMMLICLLFKYKKSPTAFRQRVQDLSQEAFYLIRCLFSASDRDYIILTYFAGKTRKSGSKFGVITTQTVSARALA